MQKKEQEVYFALHCKHSLDNIFVTKKKFFQEWASKKKFFTRTFLVDPVGWRQVNLFLSLDLYKNFSKMQYINAIRAKLTILWFSDCL